MQFFKLSAWKITIIVPSIICDVISTLYFIQKVGKVKNIMHLNNTHTFGQNRPTIRTTTHYIDFKATG